ncbi:BLUF domain-containing protein [Chitinibacter bivalviorum]|uniref:BLUF domain-containing protein n=1 Tax=Chitinibacter bivalviorum TaxID=2739434 RepID=A0A7H9BH84_9NEIS|nr:BLUF domain-containing protein [Chitinibacter bivalviorum]QLG86894.1 BLUF domain-containing protein [Chitinibacter bivalviorum]
MYLGLTYISHSKKMLTEDMRMQLMRECQVRNAHSNITGLLLYQQGFFLQYIEGEPHTVRSVYQHIQRDQRHEDIELISEEVLMERRFPHWTMFFRDYDFVYPHIRQDYGELTTLAKVVEALEEDPALQKTMFDFLKITHDQSA